MTKAKVKSRGSLRKVKFSFESTGAREVFLLGDFNKWDPQAHPMKKDVNGRWNRTLMMPPGTYEYKFIADGQWLLDPCNDQCCPNCFGSDNSVLNLELR
ncbi:MAG: isoamylase early set domain-containing protein [Desulfobacterales bacterium]|nr:isoamylase early set domain-containing protein [Desulfobacterales bacterium]